MSLEQRKEPNAAFALEIAKATQPQVSKNARPCKFCQEMIHWRSTGSRWQPVTPQGLPHHCRQSEGQLTRQYQTPKKKPTKQVLKARPCNFDHNDYPKLYNFKRRRRHP